MKQNSNPYIYRLMKLISCDPFVFPSARWMQTFHQSFRTNSRHSNARVGTCICGSLTWYCDPQKVFILGGGGGLQLVTMDLYLMSRFGKMIYQRKILVATILSLNPMLHK